MWLDCRLAIWFNSLMTFFFHLKNIRSRKLFSIVALGKKLFIHFSFCDKFSHRVSWYKCRWSTTKSTQLRLGKWQRRRKLASFFIFSSITSSTRAFMAFGIWRDTAEIIPSRRKSNRFLISFSTFVAFSALFGASQSSRLWFSRFPMRQLSGDVTCTTPQSSPSTEITWIATSLSRPSRCVSAINSMNQQRKSFWCELLVASLIA